ncbi:MAG: DinB family protein [Candidatus Acidiferrales bacterium]
MSEIDRIIDQMDRAFGGDAWHGPSLESLLEGVTAEQASQHPVPGAHSIWELVNHIALWNSIVQHRASGEKVEVSAEEDWPPVWEATKVAWQRTLEHLRECRARFRAAVQKLPENKLSDIVPGKDHSQYVMLHGAIQHDLYHAGQIAVLKKALQ